MLAGIKFIPRDQVDACSTRDISDSDSSSRERKKPKSRKNVDDTKRRRKLHHSRSKNEDNIFKSDGRKGRSKHMGRNKKRASYNSDDAIPLQSTSESHSTTDEEKLRKRRSKKRKGSSSSNEDVCSSNSDSQHQHHERRIKHVNEKKKEIKQVGVDVPCRDEELRRKEIGLDWMLKSRDAMKRRPAEPHDAYEEPAIKEEKRPNPRELNPYLKDNGSGFPDDDSHKVSSSNELLPSSVVGDGGASWRLKALKHAHEQAAREGRKLDEVVEERWGSLGHLAASVASHRVAHAHAHLHAIKDRRRVTIGKSEATPQDQMMEEISQAYTTRRDYLQSVSSHHPEMRKPKQDFLVWRKKTNNTFPRDNPVISDALSKLNKFANDGSFMDEMIRQQGGDAGTSSSFYVDLEVNEYGAADVVSSETVESQKEHSRGMQGISANQLAAKALQLRLKGKCEEAEKLVKEVESMNKKQDANPQTIDQETERNTSRYIGRRMPSQMKKREDDADLNLAHKIIQNKQYSISGQADDEYDEAPTRKRNKRKEVAAEQQNNLPKRILTQQERCQFCFENPTRPKHLVISIANFTYMMLPQGQPVVQGHCCILPLQHEASTRTVDDNVWEEIRNFKKCLIKMFSKQDKDVVFLETVTGLSKQRRHCLVECIPLPCELAKEAPLYFKKAIDEAEDEWSQHNAKRLIETTNERDLRRSIPKDFPFFHVEFGLDRGFVHVIDDEETFKSSLGLNVIRGMLRLPEEDMYRKRRHEPLEKQRLAVATFAREWEPFDWTKQLS